LLYNAWHDAIGELVSQVPGARFIDDPHSSHYIHQEQPQLVIDSVREVVEAARKKSCALGVKNHGQCVKAEKHAQRKLRYDYRGSTERTGALIAVPALSLA
jgi:hypothetical protein